MWNRVALTVITVQALAGCAERELWPAEQLDQTTAVNVTVMAEPWVYFREAPMLAANARDYINVGVVETNRAGTRAYWLGVIAWSTIDRSVIAGAEQPVKPLKVRLRWPAANLELTPASNGRVAVGLSDPVFVEPQSKFTETWYPLSTVQLKQLGENPPTSVALIEVAGQATIYEAWRVNTAPMAEFLEATGF